jgi:hypothetical protein
MRAFAAIAIVLIACGSTKPTTQEDCASTKTAFLHAIAHTYAERVAALPEAKQAGARAFFDRKIAHATATFDATCTTITDEDWRCVRTALDASGIPDGACGPRSERFLQTLLDDSE